MPLELDPELKPAMEAYFANRPAPEARGDALAIRRQIESAMAGLADLPPVPGVSRADFKVQSADGTEIGLRWLTNDGEQPGSAVVWLHGGGMVFGDVDLCMPQAARFAAACGIPVLAVDYRAAPEHPHPAPVEDAYAGVAWLHEHAAELGVDPARIAIMGESAGGGLAAGATLLARERGLPVARQILIYAMLDDRNTEPDPALEALATWSHDRNFTGWQALLGDRVGTSDVPATAAPARAEDLSGLPPAFVDVGDLDIFRDENIEYARRLAAAGTPVELHVRPGCPHAFEGAVPDADVSRRSQQDRIRVLRSL
ncbi:alpha/beta hydrolase [Saccharopolyspora gloriosae]|uniref:alpha/beta hydrolase n=1 Tax=Saccharopolyspora gloriosae TaxID=455344 RepID=UPI001FB60BD9|nr:alpha/beta hydrolase [Saccharopolyspora gloriosae]